MREKARKRLVTSLVRPRVRGKVAVVRWKECTSTIVNKGVWGGLRMRRAWLPAPIFLAHVFRVLVLFVKRKLIHSKTHNVKKKC